jgi:cytochrome c1
MKSRIIGRSALCLLLLSFPAMAGCDYAGMVDQESVRTYKKEMPAADRRTVPVMDGFQALLNADPKKLGNPLPRDVRSVAQGRQAYGYFCAQCHGQRADGHGTVGQSFSPFRALRPELPFLLHPLTYACSYLISLLAGQKNESRKRTILFWAIIFLVVASLRRSSVSPWWRGQRRG